jgi:hypothetical protein
MECNPTLTLIFPSAPQFLTSGCLPQKHHIVFTKEDFVAFLKQHNVHVGPNFTELSRLPK